MTSLNARRRYKFTPIATLKTYISGHHRPSDSARAARQQKWPTQDATLRRNWQRPTLSETFQIPRASSHFPHSIASFSSSTLPRDTPRQTTTTSTMADTSQTNPKSAPPPSPPPTNPHPPYRALRSIAKFKARSLATSKDTHIPLLRQIQSQPPANNPPLPAAAGPTVVLVGDSMLERMTTTGETPNFTAPWPSPAMLSDTALTALGKSVRRLDGCVFNAGVGGDKVQNVAYRLVGGDGEGGLPGLLPMLAAGGTVRVWVVQVGTNNLSVKKGLVDRDVDAWEVLVETLLGVNPTGGECKVLVTGLFYRKDVSGELVDRANGKIRAVVKRLQEKYGVERVVFLAPAAGVRTEEHLVDHVHLNLEGYQLWMAGLFPAVHALLN
ncbi:SGNH hydrolase-type esterase domain-containing protein [Chaetomium tenue]|uniref:SGNH hydrolase-type esterase domain-containing protein n=1 Tax=Chaetomium tenue TaxID=1854479 RepID=A0ACB7P9X6_9PEZI|nr:SGNH hydrolase-type esterase domain-containing protein [Chaetomium globosum]